jgi:hypothetical protein
VGGVGSPVGYAKLHGLLGKQADGQNRHKQHGDASCGSDLRLNLPTADFAGRKPEFFTV